VLLDPYKNGDATNIRNSGRNEGRLRNAEGNDGRNKHEGGRQTRGMLARMREEIKSGWAEMRSTLDEWLMDLKDGRKETPTCN
jgi:hypothetical protein